MRRPVCTVEHRGSHGDLLYRVVAAGGAALRQQLGWRERERSIGCGDRRQGLVPFSCEVCPEGRAFCPGCTGRRMAGTAARWREDRP